MNRRWHIAVGRRDNTLNMHIFARTARGAVDEMLRHYTFDGADIISISVTEDPV